MSGFVEFLSVNANALSVGATVVTAIVAVLALGSTARDSRARSRPEVIAMYRPSPQSTSSYELVVRNFGNSAARDLEVRFEPPFDHKALADEFVRIIADRYSGRIAILPQGNELTNLWWSGGIKQGSSGLVNHLPTPDDVIVHVSYKGNRFRRYRDTFTLEAKSVQYTTYSTSSDSMMGMTKSIRDSIKKLANETASTNRHLRGIERVITPDE